MEEEVEVNMEAEEPVGETSGSNLKKNGLPGDQSVVVAKDDHEEDPSNLTFQKKIYKFVESTPVIIFMMIVTIWALFGDDIRQVTVDVNGDNTFYVITLICFSLFAIEIALQFIANPDYRWGFFFYLDVISTVSLLLDVGFISELVLSGGTTSNTKSAASFAKTARASRIGTRAGRVVRIIRLIRLIRIVKLYKASQQAQEKRLEKQRRENEKKKRERSVGQQSGASGGVDGTIKSSAQKLAQDSNSLANKSNLNRSSANLANNNKDSKAQLGRNPSKSFDDSEFRIAAMSNSEKLSQGDVPNPEELDEFNEEDIFQETHVGKKLSDLTTKRVIILILSIMISIPVFSTDTYFTDYSSYQSGVENLLFLLNMNPDPNFANNPPFVTAWKSFVNIHTNPNENEVLKNITLQYTVSDDISNDLTTQMHLVAGTASKLQDQDLNNLRDADKDVVLAPDLGDSSSVPAGTYSITATFDQSKINNLNGYLGIGRTIFVCVVLTASAMFFSKDANELVLSPIEKMLTKVKRISRNPLKATKLEEKYDIIWEDLRASDQDNFETTILEKTIAKIGALLALGFGEAGSQIIANNLQPSGEINPMLPGRSVVAIFGFVDIKNFTVITEVLQEGIMMFVNEVADVVHNVVENYNGRANKNIGDSFLFVWKFSPEDCQEVPPNTYQAIKNKKTQAITELALLSFATIQSELKKSSRIDKYTKNPNLIAKLGNNASRFELRMGFGLHLGWAIESAIGSEFKVDASYLSPSVSIASKLESLTKHYGVSILISEDVLEMLRDPLHGFLRQIDFIKMRHAKKPFGIYTLDVNLATLIVDQEQASQKPLSAKEKMQKRVKDREDRTRRINTYLDGTTSAKEFMNSHKDLIEMRKFFKKEFFMEWDKGMAHYLEGNFEEAKSIFQATATMLSELTNEDAPSERLISIMESYGLRPPENWDEGRDVDDIMD